MEYLNKKKILHIVTRSDIAGAQKVLYFLVRGFREFYHDDYDIEVACGLDNGMLISELHNIGIKVHTVPNLVREISILKDIKAFFEIKIIVKAGNYDIIHIHSSKAGILGRIAAKLSGTKMIIYTVHGWWGIEQYAGLKQKFLIMLEKFASKFCDKIVLLSKMDLEKARSWKIGKEDQYAVIHNAIIPPKSVEKGKLRKELSLGKNIKIIGNVARLDKQKDPIKFLNIAEKVLKAMNNVVFVWIGGSVVEDEYGDYVKNFMQIHPEFEKKIFFLGFRKDAPELMADFDVFLLTSESEGFPLVLLEALYHNVIPIATRNGAQRDIIKHGENGFLYDTEEEAAKIISQILNEKQDAERMKQAVLATSNKYSFDKFIDNYKRLYDEGLKNS